MTEEENARQGSGSEPDLGKFQSVDALMHAYRELEAEFTRRSQRLKALEDAAKATSADAGEREAATPAVGGGEERGQAALPVATVPLLAGSGVGVTAPVKRVTTLKQANALALGWLKNQRKGE